MSECVRFFRKQDNPDAKRLMRKGAPGSAGKKRRLVVEFYSK